MLREVNSASLGPNHKLLRFSLKSWNSKEYRPTQWKNAELGKTLEGDTKATEGNPGTGLVELLQGSREELECAGAGAVHAVHMATIKPLL